MTSVTGLAGFVVFASGSWLVCLAIFCAFAPRRAAGFLWGFASSARSHFIEQLIRILAGAGFVLYADRLRFTPAFEVFGWVLIGTSTALLFIPWRWHKRFADQVVPMAIRHIKLYAVAALTLGLLVFYAMI